MRIPTRRIVPFLVVASLAACSSSKWKDKSPSVELQVRETLRLQVQAWNQGDVKGFMAGYEKSPRISFVSGGRIERGFDAMQERFLAGYPNGKMGTLSFSDVEVTPMSGGDAAWVLGRFKLAGEREDSGIFTLILVRADDRFLIVHDHTTADPPTTKR